MPSVASMFPRPLINHHSSQSSKTFGSYQFLFLLFTVKNLEDKQNANLVPRFFFIFFFIIFTFSSIHQAFNRENESVFDAEEVVKRSMFPDDFLFGTATSAYQIEGAYLEDGKSLNNWDVFSQIPGTISNGDDAYVADDSYHRYMEDIENLEIMGVNAYRFSISWARLLPRGRFGGVNPLGVMFYNKIIDNLLLKGIEPFVTINHQDFPQELEDRYGSWLSTSMQEDFVHFAKTCFENFGNKVKYWSTINEPNLFSDMAYISGCYPPSHCSPPFGNCSSGNSDIEPLISAHNMLLSHAKAVKLYRDHFQHKQGGIIGIVIHSFNYVPYRDDEFSHQAVERAFAFNVAWVLDPLIHGDYPPLMRKYHGKELPEFSKEEEELVKGSVDFFGINHYASLYAVDCFHYAAECTATDMRPIRGYVMTTGYRDGVAIGDETGNPRFFVVPQGMEKLMDYMEARYPNTTLYVTENGYSPPPKLSANSYDMLQDYKRVEYHKAYLKSLAKAIRKGAKVKGYFVWTLMDNFEWISGYESPYGLYYVDRKTQKRMPKLSARWYAKFLKDKSPNRKQKFIPNSLEYSNFVSPSSSVRKAEV